MKKRIFALLLAGVMVLSAGCSANVNVDPDTGVVKVDGVPLNEIVGDMDLDEHEIESEEDEKEEADSEEDSLEAVEYEGGMRIKYPEEFEDIIGMYEGRSLSWQAGSGVFLTEFYYVGVTQDWYDEKINIEEASPEDIDKYYNSKMVFADVFTIDDNRGPEELYDFLMEEAPDSEEFKIEDIEEIGKAGDWRFFRIHTYEKQPIENLDKDFKEEFLTLYDMFDEIFENAEYFEPVDPYRDIVGKKVKFTTTDIDGNEITSEEIFSKNKLTMVNVWATWCGNCIDELTELNELNESLKEKDCEVIGLLGDGTDEDKIEEGKELMKEYGVEYLNILPWDGAIDEDFVIAEGWPTTFFVDSEGRMAAMPVLGADMDLYKQAIEEYLESTESGKEDKDKASEGKEPGKKDKDEASEGKKPGKEDKDEASEGKKPGKKDKDEASEGKKPGKKDKDEDSDEKKPGKKDKDEDSVVSNNVNMYRVYVTDTDGEPVKDVMIQFCDDSTCRVQNTDKEGMASFKTDKGEYTVHILNQPKDYKKNEEEYLMPDKYSDLHIVLEKK